jgi:FKBP-type peptidyl-prolyl cis-trans isomerase (trigger factor)
LDTEQNNNLVPGFLGSLIGIRPGEAISFPIQFPESFEQESIRGVHAQFTVSVISKRAQLKICVHAFH